MSLFGSKIAINRSALLTWRDSKSFLQNQFETSATSGNLATPTSLGHGTQPRAFTGRWIDTTHPLESTWGSKLCIAPFARSCSSKSIPSFDARISSRNAVSLPSGTQHVTISSFDRGFSYLIVEERADPNPGHTYPGDVQKIMNSPSNIQFDCPALTETRVSIHIELNWCLVRSVRACHDPKRTRLWIKEPALWPG
ncbi:hypothetical protein B0H11DRAFT_1908173 [Mycena galericulata]|nr:hypothetical protein B0H11DRAFT_1908173 [Mycena galericulata]